MVPKDSPEVIERRAKVLGLLKWERDVYLPLLREGFNSLEKLRAELFWLRSTHFLNNSERLSMASMAAAWALDEEDADRELAFWFRLWR